MSDPSRDTTRSEITHQAPALADWVRRAMRFIDLCDADVAGYDEMHDDAADLTAAGYKLFGIDIYENDDACLADLEHRPLSPK